MKTPDYDIFLQRKIDLVHSANLIHTLYQQQKLGKYCDLKVLVGDKHYFVHRCIFAAASAQLDSQINGLDTIQLVGVTHYGFECLLEILYSGRLRKISLLNNRDFRQIISAADALHAESVVEYCTRERSDLMAFLLQSSPTAEVQNNITIKEEMKDEGSSSFLEMDNDLGSNLKKLEYFQKRLSGESLYEADSENEVDTSNIKSNNDTEEICEFKIEEDQTEEDSKCEICDLAFTSIRDLRGHLDSKHKPRPFRCETCGLSFKFKSNLTNHSQVHNSECVCKVCGDKFKLLKHLQEHMTTEHEQSFQKEVTTNKLWKKNLKKSRLSRFQRINKLAGNSKINGVNVGEIMRTTNGKYMCPFCSRGFERRWNLKCHLLVHKSKHASQKKTPTTSKTSESSSLRKDRRYVPGGFPCSECNKHFRNLHNLRRHAAAIHGMTSKDVAAAINQRRGNDDATEEEEPVTVVGKNRARFETNNYWCSICGRGFIRSRNLKSHMQIHGAAGEGGYPCGICGRKFMQKESLHGHLWVHGVKKGQEETV